MNPALNFTILNVCAYYWDGQYIEEDTQETDNLYVVTYMYILHLYLVETECQSDLEGVQGGGGSRPPPCCKIKITRFKITRFAHGVFCPLELKFSASNSLIIITCICVKVSRASGEVVCPYQLS